MSDEHPFLTTRMCRKIRIIMVEKVKKQNWQLKKKQLQHWKGNKIIVEFVHL